MRRLPLSDRKAALRKLLGRTKGGIQFVAHAGCAARKLCAACELGLEGIVSKRLTAPYKSGPCKSGSRSAIRSRRRICGSWTGRFERTDARPCAFIARHGQATCGPYSGPLCFLP